MSTALVGLVGRARAGKDTVAEMLADLVGAKRVAFADPIRQFCRETFDFSEEQVAGSRKEAPDPRYTREDGKPLTPRHAMQQLGTEFGRAMHPNIWIELGLRKAAAIDGPVVITDVRFQNEAQAVRDAGGMIWRVTRPGASSAPALHPSEAEQDKIVADLTLDNSGSLIDLKTLVIQAVVKTAY